MKKKFAVLYKNKTQGQVLLETAIVFISIAVLAIGSMALFSNLKLNLIKRQQTFRESRVEAVNSYVISHQPGHALSPITYLEYSPNYSLTSPGSTVLIPGVEYLEEPRLERADWLFRSAEYKITYVIPYLMGQIYLKLGGGSLADSGISGLSSEAVTVARDLTDQLLVVLHDAYDYYCEDMNAVDADNDGFIGGIGVMQDVLNNPTQGGPFDIDLECPETPVRDEECFEAQEQHQINRDGLTNSISNLSNLQPNLYTSLIYNEQKILIPGYRWISFALVPLMRQVRDDLGGALGSWSSCRRHVMGMCIQLWRVYYIKEARLILGQMVESMGATVTPTPGNLAERINSINTLLNSGSISQENVSQAVAQVEAMLASDEVVNLADNDTIKIFLSKLKVSLNSAISHWDNAEQRQRYLDNALMQAETLYEMVNIE